MVRARAVRVVLVMVVVWCGVGVGQGQFTSSISGMNFARTSTETTSSSWTSWDTSTRNIGGIAVDSVGNVYVLDNDSGSSPPVGSVRKFTNLGAFITEWGSPGSANGQFAMPNGVAVDAAGNVFVADGTNRRIQRFDSSGVFQVAWAVGDAPGGLFRRFDLDRRDQFAASQG
jgi:sugar lactone lactonase YvrE